MSKVTVWQQNKPLCIGHRGLSGFAPENSLAAITKAIEMGVDAVEIDIYLIDGELVVFHDDNLERMTGLNESIYKCSFEQLRQLNLGQGQPIPTLAEVWYLVAGKVGLNIEIKGCESGLALAAFLSQPNLKSVDLVVSSFDHAQLTEFKRQMPEIEVAPLFEVWAEEAINLASQLDAVSINIDRKTITKQLVEKVHQAGFKLFVYTVNDETEITRLMEWGVDGFFSDQPEKVLKVRDE